MNRLHNRPPKTAVLVAQRIVADIHAQGKVPGDRLPAERDMLEKYNIGRGTLRESLRFLELQGVLTLKPGPGGGPIVQKPDSTSLETTLTLQLQFENAPFSAVAESRLSIEPLTANLAALRMSPEQRAALTQNVDVMREHIDDQAIFLDMNQQFHSVIATGSGNAALRCIIDALVGLLDGSAVGVDYPEHRRIAIVEAHQAIHDAIIAGDPVEAELAMKRHVEAYITYLNRKHPEVAEWPIVWRNY